MAATSRKGKRVYEDAMWGFDGDGPYDWPTLEEGLSYVLDHLGSALPTISSYRSDHSLVWWCGHFRARLTAVPQLSEHLLRRLVDFGATLFIDTYFEHEDSGEPQST
jgi:hypothetical protein